MRSLLIGWLLLTASFVVGFLTCALLTINPGEEG